MDDAAWSGVREDAKGHWTLSSDQKVNAARQEESNGPGVPLTRDSSASRLAAAGGLEELLQQLYIQDQGTYVLLCGGSPFLLGFPRTLTWLSHRTCKSHSTLCRMKSMPLMLALPTP